MITHLCFHGIGVCTNEREPGEARYWVATDVFYRMLDLAAGHPNVQISFDDGNRSDLDISLPALRERSLSATFFVIAGRLDDPASLGAEELRALRGAGMAIGSHGWAHIPWRGLSEAEARREFVDARVALTEASAGEILDAAMPLGRYDRGSLAQLRDAGYRTVFSSDRFRARPTSWLQARYSLTASDTVDSVRALLAGPRIASEARNVAASLVKRLR